MAHIKSPNYPAISLTDAISKIGIIFEKEHMHSTEPLAIALALGYGTLNGTSNGMISALKKYGLLEPVGEGEQLRLTAEARDIILHAKGDQERVAAIQNAAFRPKLFAELQAAYGDKLPSDDSLRIYLLKRNFNPNIVGDVIRVYRDTIELVKEEIPEYNTGQVGANRSEGSIAMPAKMPVSESNKIIQTAVPGLASSFIPCTLPSAITPQFLDQRLGQPLTFNLAEDCEVHLLFLGDVTQEAVQKLIALLELTKDTFPKRQDKKPVVQVRSPDTEKS